MSIQIKGVSPDMRAVIYYKDGWENTDVIGSMVAGYAEGSASWSKEDYHLQTYIGSDRIAERTWVTNLPINLTYIKQVIIRWRGLRDDNTTFYTFSISTVKMGDRSIRDIGISHSDSFGQREDIIDVYDLRGLYYLRAHHRQNSINRQSSYMYVYEIRGEK